MQVYFWVITRRPWWPAWQQMVALSGAVVLGSICYLVAERPLLGRPPMRKWRKSTPAPPDPTRLPRRARPRRLLTRQTLVSGALHAPPGAAGPLPKRGSNGGEVQGVVEVGAEAAARGLERDGLEPATSGTARDRGPALRRRASPRSTSALPVGESSSTWSRGCTSPVQVTVSPGHSRWVVGPRKVSTTAPVAVVGGPQYQRRGAGDAFHPQQRHVGG